MKFKKIPGFGNQYSMSNAADPVIRADARTLQTPAGSRTHQPVTLKQFDYNGRKCVRLRRSTNDSRYVIVGISSLVDKVFGNKADTPQLSMPMSQVTKRSLPKMSGSTSSMQVKTPLPAGLTLDSVLASLGHSRVQSVTIHLAH